jgi:hypothetical protein
LFRRKKPAEYEEDELADHSAARAAT